MSIKLKILLLVWLVLAVWLVWGEVSKPRRMVVFCDVGQGDAALVVDGSFQMLIDSGPTGRAGVECLERNLPIWDRKIEVVILTHEDMDHSGGMTEILKSYAVERQFEQNNYSEKLEESDVIKYGEIELVILNPPVNENLSDNEGSVAGLLEYGNYAFLMMADAGAEAERRLVWQRKLGTRNEELGTRILKVSHHGSREGTTEEILAEFKPDEAVISVGKNRYGHPTGEVLERLEEHGVKVRRTDREGDVVYVIDVY